MLGTYFYHEILRKTVISFGTLFNDIHIRHKDNTGKSISDMKVALAYGPMQKFLARIEQQPDLNRATQITLPRMSFEMPNIAYDATRRALIYTLSFTAKTYLFGPVADTPEGLIKKVQLDYHTNMDRENKRRELRYVATPKAVKDYDGANTEVLTFNISATAVRITVNDTSNFSVGDRIVIDSEVMQVKEKPDATTLVVKRGFDRTLKVEHLEQAKVNKLTTADDNLIDIGDDFGFSESSSIFTDSLQFNPATRTDS